MAQNVTLWGASYSDVPSVLLPKTGGGTAQFDDTTISSSEAAAASDILSGKKAWVNGALVDGTGSGGGSPTIDSLTVTPTTSQQTFNSASVDGYKPVVVNAMPSGSAKPAASISSSGASLSTGTGTIILSKTVSNVPDVTAGYVASGTSGNTAITLQATCTLKGATTYTPGTSDQTISSGTYLTGTQTISGDANLVAGNIKSGVSIFGVNGTYTGGGTSKNVQILQSTTRTTSTSYTKLCGDITVAKTGTYDVYWTYFRSSTSGTWGSQLYIGGSAYGSAQTTYSNHVSNVHLTEVSLTADQKVSVYGRSRGSNYYAYVGQLTIIES